MQVLPASHRLSMGPPSPTLTNPDMILPFENNASSQESSPLPPRRPQQLPSPPMSRDEHAQSGSMDNRTRLKHAGHSLSPFRNGVLSRNDGPTVVRSNSERGNGRIKYENSRLSYRPSGEGPINSPPALRDDENHIGMGRLAESPEQEENMVHNTYKTPSILEEDEDDPDSHAAMTKRAEEILANAKKRLTKMEGNLNRARSTLNSRPSSSMSSYVDRDPVSLYSLQQNPKIHGVSSPLKHRQANHSLKEDRQGHARVFSETSVPSSLQTTQPNGHVSNQNEQASPDSDGRDQAWRDPNPEPARNWFWNGLTRTSSLANRHNNGLQPLNEDGPAPDSFEREAIKEEDEEDDVETKRTYYENQISAAPQANTQTSPTSGLTRAKSTTQMRDLREQMSDLKGKITTLKQRAREDSLRRRSLQSLRTPSPLNAAQQDYSGVPLAEGQNRGTGLGLIGITEPAPQEIPPKVDQSTEQPEIVPEMKASADNLPLDQEVDEDLGIASTEESVDQAQAPLETVATEVAPTIATHTPSQNELSSHLPPEKIALPREPDFSDEQTNGHRQDVELVEEPQKVGKSVDGDYEYHELMGERHEDRADAFDYENFFLHSSMGHYGRNRNSTHSSNYSVETEKPTVNIEDEEEIDTGVESPSKHGRQNSAGSISTVATYATATEGIEDEDEREWIPVQNVAGGWQVEPQKVNGHRHHKSGRSRSSPNSGEPKHSKSASKYRHEIIRMDGEISPAPPPDVVAYLASLTSEDPSKVVKPSRLTDSDKELVERATKSLAKVCQELEEVSKEGGKYEARVCRRKLDTARRHLDGEVNGEAF